MIALDLVISVFFCRKFYRKFGSPDIIDMTRHTDTTVCDRCVLLNFVLFYQYFTTDIISVVGTVVTALLCWQHTLLGPVAPISVNCTVS